MFVSFQNAIKVSVYYESLCPYSIRFITQQLYPNYDRFASDLSLDLVPYGKANVSITTQQSSTPSLSIHFYNSIRSLITSGNLHVNMAPMNAEETSIKLVCLIKISHKRSTWNWSTVLWLKMIHQQKPAHTMQVASTHTPKRIENVSFSAQRK